MKYKRDEKLLREMYSSETLAIFKHHLSDNPWLRLVDSYINALPPTRLYGVKMNGDRIGPFRDFDKAQAALKALNDGEDVARYDLS